MHYCCWGLWRWLSTAAVVKLAAVAAGQIAPANWKDNFESGCVCSISNSRFETRGNQIQTINSPAASSTAGPSLPEAPELRPCSNSARTSAALCQGIHLNGQLLGWSPPGASLAEYQNWTASLCAYVIYAVDPAFVLVGDLVCCVQDVSTKDCVGYAICLFFICLLNVTDE